MSFLPTGSLLGKRAGVQDDVSSTQTPSNDDEVDDVDDGDDEIDDVHKIKNILMSL